MTELKKVTDCDLNRITSPSVKNIILTMKKIQARMKEPDVVNLSYMDRYTLMTIEFTQFAERYGTIFSKLVGGGDGDLELIAQILYYKDKEEKGIISEDKIFKMVEETYLSDKIKTMIKEAENNPKK